jgi:outer membrane murein-binding lipoprotein Lpp
MLRSVRQLLVGLAAVALLAGGSPASAQDMTSSDVIRLEQSVDQISADLVKLRQRDRAAARSLQDQLTELDEEVTYLKVKLRRERFVSRADYVDVRDRLENLRARVNGNDTSATSSSATGSAGTRNSGSRVGDSEQRTTQPGVVPAGTELDVRLERALSSDTARVEDRFDGTTVVDLREGGRVLIPSGSRVRGVVTGVKDAGRVERKGELQLSFDQITINGRSHPMRATVTEALEAGGYRQDAEKIGAGAAVGAILGGILGGVKGAITGILIGGGGVVAATEGQDVKLAPGTILRVRLDQDLNTGTSTRQ